MLGKEEEEGSDKRERRAFDEEWRRRRKRVAWVVDGVGAGTVEREMEVGLEGLSLLEKRVGGEDDGGDVGEE